MISEVVWWITIVDATLVRYYPDTYDAVLAGQPRAQRELTEGTLAGLRFVRNRTGHDVDHADFIRPRPGDRGADDGITGWTWAPALEPTLASLSPRGQDWELARGRPTRLRSRATPLVRCSARPRPSSSGPPRAARWPTRTTRPTRPARPGRRQPAKSQGRGGLTAVPR